MREVEITPEINSVIVGKAVSFPFAEEMKRIANDISSSLRVALDAGDIGDIEAAGRQALAAMLTLYADGSLPLKQAFAFLKSLSERKTPDPVQKIEQHTVTDMRVLVQELITANPAALENTLARAEAQREEIRQRLDATPALQLSYEHALPASDASLPLPPVEIDNIRAGRSPQEGLDGFKRFSNNENEAFSMQRSSLRRKGDRQ